MDNITLKKKLSTYLSSKGQLRNLNDEILYEVLVAWENWTGPSSEFYRSLGFSYKQLAGLIGKAKKLKREGYFGSSEFKQVKVEQPSTDPVDASPCIGAEVVWPGGRIIRFQSVEMLLEFLKKAV